MTALTNTGFSLFRMPNRELRPFRKQYNKQQPHSFLSGLTPYEFFKEQQNKKLPGGKLSI
jgi:hypothetical protein